MFLHLNFAELLALRNGAVRIALSADQTQADSRVFTDSFDRFLDDVFDDGAPPGVPMN